MSILIKGMKMPKDCVHCSFQGFGGRMNERILCMLTGTNDYINQQSKFADCPLIEVPSPHGRLIDADELNELIDSGFDLDFDEVPETKRELMRMIEDAPTIIPADKDGER